MSDLKRTVLVTGASSGIGRAAARRLLSLGHEVIGSARDIACFSKKHSNFTGWQLPLDDPQALPQEIELLQKKHPDIDAVVFCAGYGHFANLEEFSYAQIQALLQVNLTSQIFLARGMLTALKRKPRSDMIFIGSEAALKGSRKGAVYCASKFALRGFTQALREECARNHLRISLINPGMVQTNFFDNLAFTPGAAPENHLLPEDVAAAIGFILAASEHTVIDEINLNPLNKVVQFKKTPE